MKKFGPFHISLAKPTPPKTGIEVGSATSGRMSTIFDGEFYDDEPVTVEDLKKMLDCDSTIQALYNTMVMPLLGSNWTIEPDLQPDEEDQDAIDQSTWVENALRKPPHKGGMSTPFDLVLAQALRAILEGFAGFEKVYEISEGKLVYKKIAWRDPTTLTMLTDLRGGFNGLKQRAFIGNTYSEITIPLERAWLFTYGKEFHNLRGRSAFRAAYGSYDKKRRFQYLAELQAQSDALKIKVVEQGDKGGQDELDITVGAVDELGVKATVGVPNGYKVSALDQGSSYDIMKHIEFQNAEMARSVLAMFILLGTGKTGSYALSTDQSDFFIQALMSIRKSLENHITSYLLPDLYVYNFASPKYGTFKFEDITDSTIDTLKQAFLKLIEKDRLPEDVLNGVVQKVADKLDIDVDVMNEATGVEPVEDPAVPPTSNNSRSTIDFSLHGWKRELTEAEKSVNFTGIEKKLDSLEGDFERTIKPIYDQLTSSALSKASTYIENGEFNKLTEKNLFDENLKNQYVAAIRDSGMEAYTYGKNGAADELEKNIPATPKESKDFFKNDAQAIADKQFSDLIFKIQAEASKAQRKDQLSKSQLSVGDVITALTLLFSDYYKDTIGLTGTVIVAKGVNIGRKDVFATYSGDIYAYQYSAILDSNTCATCEALDGKVLDEATYKNTTYDPPIHFNCRCIWVAILKDEQDPPPITGLPDNTSVLVPPSLSTKELEDKVEFLFDALAEKIVVNEFSDPES